MSGVSGLGNPIVAAIAAVVGPIVEGGASIFAVRESGKQQRKELQQRQAEAQQAFEAQRAMLEAQERQHALAQQAALQQTQLSRAWGERVAPYVVGGLGIAAAGLVLTTLVRSRKTHARR